MLKITIKSIYGNVLFEYEKENNTTKDTVDAFLKENIDKIIKDVDLSNLDLSEISFDNSRFYNSRFDNSRFYNSSFDNSRFYNSRFDNSRFDNSRFDNSRFDNSRFDNSHFDNSHFYNSSFYNSSFYNSSFYNSSFYNSSFDNSSFDNSSFDKIDIKRLQFFSGLYKYVVVSILSVTGEKWVKMGCYTRTVKEWDEDFWNNPNDFTDHESEESKLRLFAYKTAKSWFKIVK